MTRQLVSLAGNLLRSTVMATAGKSARTARAAVEAALLTSRDNRWLKEFRVALRGGLPTESGFVGVEGVRLVEEALRSGCRMQAVLFSESGERHHERLSSFIDRPEMAFPVLRTAAAFGATGAATVASGISGTANPFSPKALRASAGAALHLPILAGVSLSILLAQLKVAGVRTLASSVREPSHGEQAPLAPWEVDWCQPVALLVGNEGAGLPEEVERSADARIRIPMASGIESLNAAAAAAVVFYEAARQRNSPAASGIQSSAPSRPPKIT